MSVSNDTATFAIVLLIVINCREKLVTDVVLFTATFNKSVVWDASYKILFHCVKSYYRCTSTNTTRICQLELLRQCYPQYYTTDDFSHIMFTILSEVSTKKVSTTVTTSRYGQITKYISDSAKKLRFSPAHPSVSSHSKCADSLTITFQIC